MEINKILKEEAKMASSMVEKFGTDKVTTIKTGDTMPKVFIKASETATGLTVKYRIGDKYVYEKIAFKNYFYVDKETFDTNPNIRKILMKYCDKAHAYNAENGMFIKLYMMNNFDRYNLKHRLEFNEGIKVFEADINAVKHWMIENRSMKLHADQLRVTYYDIETDDRGEFLKENDGTVIAHSPVMSCAFCSEDANEDADFLISKDVDDMHEEIVLIQKIAERIKNSDIVTAWNGKKFDEPFLRQRDEFLGKYLINWKLTNRFDEMVKFKKSNGAGFKSYSLNNVSKILLKDEKVDLGEGFKGGNGGFYNAWKNDKKLFEKYNKQDVLLMRALEHKTKNYQVHKVCSELCHCPIEDTMFNSMMTDYLMLNRYADRNLVAPSKPGPLEKENRAFRGGISGGYTFCFIPGFHRNVTVVDYKSHYPLCMLTFNISPETYVSNHDIDWAEIEQKMDKDKLDFMKFAHEQSSKHKNAIGKFIGSTYKKALAKYKIENKVDYDLTDLMYEFLEKYNSESPSEYAKAHGYVCTPADFNFDTNGWHFHQHRMFKNNKVGVVPELQAYVLAEREKSKGKMKQMVKDKGGDVMKTAEYIQAYTQQIAIKTVGNASFGFLAFHGARFYEWDVADSITTSARWIMKKSVIFARAQGWTVTNGDTDSVFIMRDGKEIPMSEINIKYYNYYKDLFTPFNCNYRKEVKNPETGEMETNPYYCVFEHEHTYRKLIVVAKKRYYFLEEFSDKEGNKTSVVNTMGGAFKKRDTNPLAAKLQKELCSDVLNEVYKSDKWIKILEDTKEQCYGNKLPVDLLTYSKTYPKHWSEYGQATIDSTTGLPKKRADGQQQFAPVPAHIRMIKRLEDAGENFQIGDAVKYIVAKPVVISVSTPSQKKADKDQFNDALIRLANEHIVDFKKSLALNKNLERWGSYKDESMKDTELFADIRSLENINKESLTEVKATNRRRKKEFEVATLKFLLEELGIDKVIKYFDEFNITYKTLFDSRQNAISVKEYEAGASYNHDAYFARIISPIVEILNVVDKEAITHEYKHCWNFTEKQLEKLIEAELEGEAADDTF